MFVLTELVLGELVLQAVEQMEERLSQFIDNNQLEELEMESDGAVRFVQHQVVELARDCLAKSVSKHISTSYFCELSNNLERLLNDVGILSVCRYFTRTRVDLKIVKIMLSLVLQQMDGKFKKKLDHHCTRLKNEKRYANKIAGKTHCVLYECRTTILLEFFMLSVSFLFLVLLCSCTCKTKNCRCNSKCHSCMALWQKSELFYMPDH